MKYVYAIVFAFMTLVTMSSVALDIKRVNFLGDGKGMSDAGCWLRAAIWVAMLYAFGLFAWETFK